MTNGFYSRLDETWGSGQKLSDERLRFFMYELSAEEPSAAQASGSTSTSSDMLGGELKNYFENHIIQRTTRGGPIIHIQYKMNCMHQ